MSAFHGPQGPGAMRRHRDEKRAAAEEHARHTKPSHTKAIRLGAMCGGYHLTSKEGRAA